MDKTNGRSFCVGSGQGITIKDAFLKVISVAQSITGVHVDYEHVTPTAEMSDIEFRNAVIDFSAFRQSTGWVAQYNFDSALKKAYLSQAAQDDRF